MSSCRMQFAVLYGGAEDGSVHSAPEGRVNQTTVNEKGAPLQLDASFPEIVSYSEQERTLRTIELAKLAASLVTTQIDENIASFSSQKDNMDDSLKDLGRQPPDETDPDPRMANHPTTSNFHLNIPTGIVASNPPAKPKFKRCRTREMRMQRDLIKHAITSPACAQTCHKKCSNFFTEPDRQRINREFWSMSPEARQVFIYETATKSPKKRSTITGGGESRRKHTFHYRMRKSDGDYHSVCKIFYTTTLGWKKNSDKVIKNILFRVAAGTICPNLPDRRGKHPPSNKIDRELIKAHIQSYGPAASRNRRKAPKVIKLPSDVNYRMMHMDFCNKYGKIGLETYRKVLRKMNISKKTTPAEGSTNASHSKASANTHAATSSNVVGGNMGNMGGGNMGGNNMGVVNNNNALQPQQQQQQQQQSNLGLQMNTASLGGGIPMIIPEGHDVNKCRECKIHRTHLEKFSRQRMECQKTAAMEQRSNQQVYPNYNDRRPMHDKGWNAPPDASAQKWHIL